MGNPDKTRALKMATVVEIAVAIIVVKIIEPGYWAPAAALSPIMPDGKIANPDVLIAKNKHMELVATPWVLFSLFISIMALRPNGVAALPKPSILEVIFMIIMLIAGCSAGTSGNSRTITGLRKLAMSRKRPPWCRIRIIPSQKAITPTRPIAKSTAALAESTKPSSLHQEYR